jgi:hypothetical protein
MARTIAGKHAQRTPRSHHSVQSLRQNARAGTLTPSVPAVRLAASDWAAEPPYNTRNVRSDVSRATIEPPLSRASSRYSTASALTRKPSRITGIPGG